MIILADENIHTLVVERLRSAGHEVDLVADLSPTASDDEVLAIAVQRQALLITHDLDFGELVYRRAAHHAGVLILRLGDVALTDQAKLVTDTIGRHGSEIHAAFSVLSGTRLRIRS